jgi:cyanophycinase
MPRGQATSTDASFRNLEPAENPVVHREDFQQPSGERDVLQSLGTATGVFFVGGEPVRIVRAIKGTAIDRQLHERLVDGLVVAGTSAGALMMPEVVIMDGESRTHPADTVVDPGPGMGFSPKVVLDVHFAERGRIGRMLTALAKFPDCLGIALDEDAALVIKRDACQVIGKGSVFFYDPSRPDFKKMSRPGAHSIALAGVRLHVLTSGLGFDLKRRVPLEQQSLADHFQN